MKLEVEKESVNDIVIEKPFPRPSFFSRFGQFMGIVSLVTGLLAMLFSIAPYFIVWSAFVFWILYPCAVVSFISSILAYISHQFWKPTLGIVLSLSAIVIAMFSGDIYVLGLAGSVNEMTSTAKIFIDALRWPF